MSKSIYPRLAATNLRKNGSTYFPYMLTSVCSILTFYTMHALANNPGLKQMPGAGSLTMILHLGVIVIGVFSAVLLFYTNGFLIKRRKRELGLYSILGLEKKHIARILFFETLYTTCISLAVGLLGGILIGKLLFMLLLGIVHANNPLPYTVDPATIWTTLALFGVIFLLTLLTNLRQIRIANPIALLRGGEQGEKEPKASIVLAVVGVLSLGGGYAISLLVKSPLEALLLFFVAVLLVILGTYCLFTAVSIAVLRLMKRKKSFYYKPGNFIAVSGMLYRMKQNAVGLANICILSTMVLVTVSTTVSLYVGKDDMLRQRFPLDMTVSVSGEDALDKAAGVDTLLDEQAAAGGVTLTARYHYWIREFYSYQIGERFLNEITEAMSLRPDSVTSIHLLTLEDYNRLQGTRETLGEGEVLLFTDRQAGYGHDVMDFVGRRYRVKKEVDDLVLDFKKGEMVQAQYYIVLPDIEEINRLALAHEGKEKAPSYEIACNIQGEDEAVLAFSKTVTNRAGTLYDAGVSSLALSRMDWYGTFGGFLFIGIFLGLLFMMATVLIIYYKQISEGYDDNRRFDIMQRVGMSKKEVRAAIRKQILLVFFLPLLVAAVHITMAFPVITKLLAMFALANTTLILLCTVITLLVFAAAYALVYTATARTYYKLVS